MKKTIMIAAVVCAAIGAISWLAVKIEGRTDRLGDTIEARTDRLGDTIERVMLSAMARGYSCSIAGQTLEQCQNELRALWKAPK